MSVPSQLQRPEFRFCLLKPQSKIPFEHAWQQNGYRYDDKKLQAHIAAGGNYGVIGGYGNLRIIDIDTKNLQHEQTAAKLRAALQTFEVRTGSGGSHFYILSDYDTNHVFANGAGEFRALNYQVVAPGCTHPNGNIYTIAADLPIQEVSQDKIKELLAPLLRHEPPQNPTTSASSPEQRDKSRSGKEFAEACKLIRQGKSREEVFQHMTAYAKWSDAPEQYRQRTYEKALAAVEKSCTRNTPTGLLKITNYIENVQLFHSRQPFFYDKAGLFWFWQDNKYEMLDDVDVMNMLEAELGLTGETVQSSVKNGYLEAFKRIGRQHIPADAPLEWVQFGDDVHNIKTGETFKTTPQHFFTNPIPHTPRNVPTPTIDRLFKEWAGDHADTLKEIVAYCCYRGYTIAVIFYFIGTGRNGKGQFMRVVRTFLGDNVSSASLGKLTNPDSRFESIKLYKKLAAQIGETDAALLKSTDLLKRLTGGDLIDFEVKGKTPFSAENYSKLLINSNGLPITADHSDGFYRRAFIVQFPNEFPEGQNPAANIPPEEYQGLAQQVIELLPTLIERGQFSKQGSIPERKAAYQLASNPLPVFLRSEYDMTDVDAVVRYGELYTAYTLWLKDRNKRRVSPRVFSELLAEEGLEIRRTTVEGTSDRWVYGLKPLEAKK